MIASNGVVEEEKRIVLERNELGRRKTEVIQFAEKERQVANSVGIIVAGLFDGAKKL